jgi:hypothetical protein
MNEVVESDKIIFKPQPNNYKIIINEKLETNKNLETCRENRSFESKCLSNEIIKSERY